MTGNALPSSTRGQHRVRARFCGSEAWDSVRCHLCPHQCSIAPSRSGSCGVRSNRGGTLYCDNHGKVTSINLVEAAELPLYHLRPSMRWLLAGMKGCNMRCPFCSTFNQSQVGGARTIPATPENLVRIALTEEAGGIGFGISEPAIAHEFVADVFAEARKHGLATFLQTNGLWSSDPFREILELTDAITFGFKGFHENFLMTECGGHLDLVKHNVESALRAGKHVEMTYLAIEGHEDRNEQLAGFARWLSEYDSRVPVILLPLIPSFLWKDRCSTPDWIRVAYELLTQSLDYVYVQDQTMGLMDTRCRGCSRVLVRRGAAGTVQTESIEGCCPHCRARVPIMG